MFKRFMVVVSAVGLAVMVGCGSNAESNDPKSNTGGGGSHSVSSASGTSKYTCCLNGTNYTCPNEAAFDKCAGFDIDACMQGCNPADFQCTENCFDQWSNATNDPSDCNEDPSAQCGGGGGGGGGPGLCVGDWDGTQCDVDGDCSSFNCFDNKCYGNEPGNPCEVDGDCSSFNCYQNCCYDNDAGNPCEVDGDCSSFNCFNNECQ